MIKVASEYPFYIPIYMNYCLFASVVKRCQRDTENSNLKGFKLHSPRASIKGAKLILKSSKRNHHHHHFILFDLSIFLSKAYSIFNIYILNIIIGQHT